MRFFFFLKKISYPNRALNMKFFKTLTEEKSRFCGMKMSINTCFLTNNCWMCHENELHKEMCVWRWGWSLSLKYTGRVEKNTLNNPSIYINLGKVNIEVTFNSAAQMYVNLCHARNLKKRLFKTSVTMQCNSSLQEPHYIQRAVRYNDFVPVA